MDQKDYETTRIKNVEDNKAFLKELMKDFDGVPLKRNLDTPKRKYSKRVSDPTFVVRRNPSRSSRFTPRFNPYGTRSRTRRGSECTSESSSNSSSPNKDENQRLLVRFGIYRDVRSLEDEENADPQIQLSPKKRRSRPPTERNPRKIRPPEDISEEEMKMVADSVRDKSYDQVLGTSCHQCRQKTDDMKTICRDEECNGVRGQFCGPCLRNRYGEDARTALKDPDWMCPPCRGICNCSICRRRSGKSCTGILVHVAKEEGFSDVASYLHSFKKN